MKAFWILIIAAAPVLAQEPTYQLQPLETLIKNVPFPRRPPIAYFKGPIILKTEAKVCAIPLLQVTPKGDYPMTIVKPSETELNMPKVTVPAPACER